MVLAYPNLRAAIARRGIKNKAIADYLGISTKALCNKMSGRTDFTWPEVCKIRDNFFPDMCKDELFKNGETYDTA